MINLWGGLYIRRSNHQNIFIQMDGTNLGGNLNLFDGTEAVKFKFLEILVVH